MVLFRLTKCDAGNSVQKILGDPCKDLQNNKIKTTPSEFLGDLSILWKFNRIHNTVWGRFHFFLLYAF